MPLLHPEDYTVAWIAPLEIEARAALYMLDERHEGKFPVSRGNDYIFHPGKIRGHNIIVATLPAGQEYGTGSAAALASQVKAFFPNLWFGLLVGVATGLPNLSLVPPRDIRLGDVLVGLPEGESAGLIAYDLGKETEDGFQLLRFGHVLATTEPIIRSAIRSIKLEAPNDALIFVPHYEAIREKEHATGDFRDPGQEQDKLYLTKDDGTEELVKRNPRENSKRTRVWYGPIGSGDKLLENAQKRNELRDKHDVIGLEMEAAGTMNRIPVGVIRGVCDYGDKYKNNEWQPYAAAMAAAYAKAVLCEILPKAAQKQLRVEISNIGLGPTESLPSPTAIIPFSRDVDFVERGSILSQVHQKCIQPGSRTALLGLGGVGKSQLAIEYAYRVRERIPETWVFWVHASNAARLEQSFWDIANYMMIPERHNARSNIFQLVHDWLRDERKGKWVLILDNLDDAGFLFDSRKAIQDRQTETHLIEGSRPLVSYIPQCPNGSILLTTRNKEAALRVVESRDIITVKPMNSTEAVALFEKKVDDVNHDNDGELVAALEFMPLAIVQAAAYISQRAPRYSTQEYLKSFRKSDQKRIGLLNSEGGQRRRDTEAKNSIIITWQISFEFIRQIKPSAADLLALMSFFDRQGIPESLIRDRDNYSRNQSNRYRDSNDDFKNDDDSHDNDGNSISEDDVSQSSIDDGFEDDIITLRNFSFISVTKDATTFEMHALVQLAMRRWLEVYEQQEIWKQRFVAILCAKLPTGEYENWAKCQALFPHAQSASVQIPPKEDESLKDWALIIYRAAWYAWKVGNLAVAERMAIQAMKVRGKLFNRENEDFLWSMAMVAVIYNDQGRWDAAEELEVQVMETRKEELGVDHPDTLISMANLASTLWNQGRWDAAEELEVQVMEIRKNKLGADHPSTLISMANLASTYRNQGRWNAAEELEVQVVEIRKNKLGTDHPSTLTSMANLASTYRNQGRWDAAEELEIQVVEIRKNKFGMDHPDTPSSMSNLALTLSNQGRWDAAEELEVQVVEIRKNKLGADHPDTLNSMGNLALTLSNQGRWDAAEELEVQVMEMSKNKLGAGHPYTLTCMHNLAFTWKVQGRDADALDLMRDCVRRKRNILRAGHPDLVSSSVVLDVWDKE